MGGLTPEHRIACFRAVGDCKAAWRSMHRCVCVVWRGMSRINHIGWGKRRVIERLATHSGRVLQNMRCIP
jgi:hypothetical protein